MPGSAQLSSVIEPKLMSGSRNFANDRCWREAEIGGVYANRLSGLTFSAFAIRSSTVTVGFRMPRSTPET